MTKDEETQFHLTSFVFDLDSDDLDELLEHAGLTWESATPKQVRELVKARIGDAAFYQAKAFGDRLFGYDREFDSTI